jgi:predicted ATPase
MRLRIQNFKSYADTGFLELKPLTLIFGKNSAGKSAVIQALNALSASSFANEKRHRESYLAGDSDDQTLSFYGDTWDLGDFERTVHNRDKTASIKFELEFNLFEQYKGPNSEQNSRKLEAAIPEFKTHHHVADIPIAIGLGFETPGTLNFLSISTKSEIPFISLRNNNQHRSSERSLLRGLGRETSLTKAIFESLRDDMRVREELLRALTVVWKRGRFNSRELLKERTQFERSSAKVEKLNAEIEDLRHRLQATSTSKYQKIQLQLAKEQDREKRAALESKLVEVKRVVERARDTVSKAKKYEDLKFELEFETEKLERLQRLRRAEERRNFELRSFESLEWMARYESPEIFLMDSSYLEFEEAFQMINRIQPVAIRRLEERLGSILSENWLLPPINLTLNECSKGFGKSIRKQLRKKNQDRFIGETKFFLIEHDYIIRCLSNLPIRQIAQYWSEMIQSVRFVTTLGPTPQIFAIDTSEDDPKLMSDESIYDSPLGFSEASFGILSFIASIITRTLWRFRSELKSITHIPAFRGSPKRTWDRESRDEIAKSLNRLSEKELRKLNSVLRLIGWKQLFDVSVDSDSGENRKITKLRALDSSKRSKEFETLLDVGFGFSQILPILENAIRQQPKTFLVEEPEVHLHPSLQGDLIELIARNSSACTDIPMEKVPVDSPVGNDHKWFIETHSEYMLRRIQKLVAKGVLDNKKIGIYYCDIDDEGERMIWPIKLGQKGQMLDPWPNDFIETELETELDSLSTQREMREQD